ncbi:hypothetical protein VB713_00795 [Anabaena cylindrica UHCC 0172]|uniref:hypothetical protein n=1 Tax=Anabaena cylindrica TaxID=1165 RepID=UPI002B204385|nr:hypothetical protein [Anabaena cylindrica]MEA5549530.1 hypothetical protein [Anabaena cylindrica UHCC 0172]
MIAEASGTLREHFAALRISKTLILGENSSAALGKMSENEYIYALLIAIAHS